jgi:anti-sigma factor RsiW
MEQTHVFHLLSDYVLELLPVSERQQVERHTATCELCRQAIRRERRIGQAVKATMTAVTWPNAGRLQQFMPAPPAPARPGTIWRWPALWPTPASTRSLSWAAVCLLFLFIIGSFGAGPLLSRSWPVQETAVATTTLTSTASPTAVPDAGVTATSTAVVGVSFAALEPAVPHTVAPALAPLAATRTLRPAVNN